MYNAITNIIIFEKLWHKMSFMQLDLNLVILWQDLSLVGRWFQSLGAATEKDLSPQVRGFEVGSFMPQSHSRLFARKPLPDCSRLVTIGHYSKIVSSFLFSCVVLASSGSVLCSFLQSCVVGSTLQIWKTRHDFFSQPKKIVAGFFNREGRHGHMSCLKAVADELARMMSGCV